MATAERQPPAGYAVGPRLRFEVRSAESVRFTAVPTLKFELLIEPEADDDIRSILLDVQVQIASRLRGYSDGEGERLLELFGTPERWANTLRTLPWLRTTLVVPPFRGRTVAELLVACTYDFEVAAARYLAALEDGEIPLELLLSGSVFFATPSGALQTARISWDQELDYSLPVEVYKQTMAQHFPDSAWLRLRTDSFNRLCAFKARHAYESWDRAIDALLEERAS